MHNKIWKLFIWTVLFTVLLTGCKGMTGRLLQVKQQMCDFDNYVAISFDQGVEVNLNTPVLRESDVSLLMAAKPTQRIQTPDGVTASYVFELVENPGSDLTPAINQTAYAQTEMRVDFHFVQSDDALVLDEIKSSRIPDVLSEMVELSVENSAEMAEQACDGKINIFSRSFALDLDNETMNLLPPRDSVISWLGEPNESTAEPQALEYQFQLKGTLPEQPVASFAAGYDESGEQTLGIEMSYARYRAHIDVPAGELELRLY
jgi:hypothetical protein